MRGRVKLPPVYPAAPWALSPLRLPDSAHLCLETRVHPLQLHSQSAVQLLSSLHEPQPQTPTVQLSNWSPYYVCSNFAHSLPSQPEKWFTIPRSSPFPRQCRLPSHQPFQTSPGCRVASLPVPRSPALPSSAGKENCSKAPVALQALVSVPHHPHCGKPRLWHVGLGPQHFSLGPHSSGVVPMTSNKR